jgi:hypothetical protein
MTASLKRAIGHWATSQVEDLHAFADDLANRNHRYPQLVVTQLSHDTQALGCGRTEYVVRDPKSGVVSKTGKLGVKAVSYRLTVTAPSDRHRNGQEIVDGILEAIESAALLTWLSAGPLTLTDPDVDPSAVFKLDSLKPIGRQSIPPDITGEPFLYRAALTLSIRRYVPVERPVEHVIERIHLNEETP